MWIGPLATAGGAITHARKARKYIKYNVDRNIPKNCTDIGIEPGAYFQKGFIFEAALGSAHYQLQSWEIKYNVDRNIPKNRTDVGIEPGAYFQIEPGAYFQKGFILEAALGSVH